MTEKRGVGLAWLRNAVETVVNGDECLFGWPYGISKGYPYVWFEGRAQYACRVIIILSGVNPTPEKHYCCHSCDNPACLNKYHLRFGTNQDNMADRDSRNRQVKGEAAGGSKLTESQVLAIRERYASGKIQRDIAAEFRITQSQVSSIVNQKSWAHVP